MAEPTQVIQNTTTIPDYARPYVEQMLGMVGGSLYDYEVDSKGQMIYRDSAGKIVAPGTAGAQPTPKGLKPYTPYPGDRTAIYDELQKKAYEAVNKNFDPLGYDPYSISSAKGLEDLAGQAGQYGYNPSSFNYLQATAPRLQNYQMAEPADVAAQRVSVGNINAAQMAKPADVAAQRVSVGNINAAQMGPAQQVGTQNFTSPGAVNQYMSPYQQSVIDIGKREAKRQADIAGTQRGARQAQAGAFGGSRSAIENAEAQRNLAQQMEDIQSKGSQEAYAQAAQMFTSDQARQLAAQQANQQAGLTVGTQNLSTQQQANVQNMANQLQASGMNAQQAMQAALANQQMGYNVGTQNLSTQQQANVQNIANQLQASGMNAQQAMQAALANQQMGYNVGNQNLQANLGVQSLGSGQNLQAQLANQMTNQQMQQLAEQSKQYGAGLGLQGLQAGMQGYSNLANVGQNLYGQNVSNINAQAQFGGQKQQQAQNVLNQKYQDFLTQQQFPYQQSSYMSNILRGVPLQQGTQSVYSAPPSFLSQVAGAGLTGYSLNNLFGTPTPKAEGGEIREERRGPSGLSALVLSKMG